jgi:hypothetical protein
MKKLEKNGVGVSDCIYWPQYLSMAASSGFYQSSGPPPSDNVQSIVPAHCCGHQNGHQSWSFFVVMSFAVALAAAGAILSK